MKVYNKNSNIMCYKQNVFRVMDNFFHGLPKEYSKNYYKNLDTLSIIRTNNINNGINTGLYDADNNIIYYVDNNTIGHELFHVASNDMDKKIMGIDEYDSEPSALLEGMTELLFIKTYNIKDKHAYNFEVMVSEVLSQIPRFFQYYFIPSYDKFINIFNNPDTIKRLMDNLNVYRDISDYYLTMIYLDGINAKIDNKLRIELICSIEEVINCLIQIGYENKDKVNLNDYLSNLDRLLKKDDIKSLFSIFYDYYYNYADKQIKKVN